MQLNSTHDMKTVEIESTPKTYDYDTLISFVQMVAIAVNSKNESELRELMSSVPHISFIPRYFAWGFGGEHFWVKQRIAPKSDELNEDRILIVKF